MEHAAGAGPDDCFANLLRYRHAHLVSVPAPNCDGEGKPSLPAQDSISSQPAVDFHAELKRNLAHVTAESDLDHCDPHRVELLDDLVDDEDILEPGPLYMPQVDSTSAAESLLDPFDDYVLGWAFEREPSSSANEANTAITDLSAEKVAYLFAEQAASKLDMIDFHRLLDFLNREPQSGDLKSLKELTCKGMEAFYENELKLSGGTRDRLTRPSGPENADLGLVLHVASKEDEIEDFWDVESRTIQLLIQKGVLNQDDSVFAFDWHWRAEGKRSKRKGPCPTTTWSRKLQLLHDTFSATLLEQLPLPLLIIAGACPVRQYWNTLPPAARHVELKIAIPDSPGPDAEIAFHLDFRNCGLKRIVACVDHPSAIFFRRQHYNMNIRLDAVFNFFLWLNGKTYDRTTFTGRKSGESEGLRFAEPWKELHEYNKKERALGRHLAQADYEQSFFLWAKGYLKDDPAAILAHGESLVAQVDRNFKKTVRLALAKRFGHEYTEYWHNKKPKISVATGPATIKLYVDPEKPALQFRSPWELGAMINASLLDLTIKFREDHVALYLGSGGVFSQSQQSLTGSGAQVKEWDQQFDKELRQSRKVVKDLENQGSPESLLAECVRHTQAPTTELWMATHSRGKRKHLHLCIRSKHLIGKFPDIERWDGTCRAGCILQEEQDIDHSKVSDEKRKEQTKTKRKASNDRSDYHKAYCKANKEEKQAKNRAYQERNKADPNETAKIRMRALRQHRKAALQRDATTVNEPDVDERYRWPQ